MREDQFITDSIVQLRNEGLEKVSYLPKITSKGKSRDPSSDNWALKAPNVTPKLYRLSYYNHHMPRQRRAVVCKRWTESQAIGVCWLLCRAVQGQRPHVWQMVVSGVDIFPGTRRAGSVSLETIKC